MITAYRTSPISGTMANRRINRFERKTINCADRVYACLTVAGRKVAELTRDGIDSYSSLVFQLRALAPDVRGLGHLTVRNMSRGWRMERPLMLYSDRPMPVACC